MGSEKIICTAKFKREEKRFQVFKLFALYIDNILKLILKNDLGTKWMQVLPKKIKNKNKNWCYGILQ